MRDVEMRQLRYFVAVAEERNFTRAAERLAMTQPALSRAIRDLEKDVGTELLRRTPRDVAPTAAGLVLLEEARALLAQLGNAVSRTRRTAEGDARLTATAPGCDALLLDALVRSYNARHPAVPASASVGTADDQVDRLRAGAADLALLRSPLDRAVLDGVLLRREQVFVRLSVAHPLADRRAVETTDLAGEPLVRWQGANPQVMAPDIWPDGLPGRPGPPVSDGLQMMAVVALGQGFALTSSPASGPDGEGTTTVRLLDAPRVELRLVWLHANATPAVRRFARHAAAHVAGGRASRTA